MTIFNGVTDQKSDTIIRCKSDPLYFFENFVKLQHPHHGSVPFLPHDCQKDVVNAYLSNNAVIISKSRQVGMSTLNAMFMLWQALFFPNQTVIALSNKIVMSFETLDRIRFAIQHLPDYMKGEFEDRHRSMINLENGSVIMAASSSFDCRGLAFDLVCVDELAFFCPERQNEFLSNVLPSLVSRGGKILIASTRSKSTDAFDRIYREAMMIDEKNGASIGVNGFRAIEIPYSSIPGRNEEWAHNYRKLIGDEAFEREYACKAADMV